MTKIKIRVTINDNIINEYDGEINKNLLLYNELDDTKVILDYENNRLTRENEELRMEYTFIQDKATIGNILVKDLNQSVDINIKTNMLEKSNHNLNINYNIENDVFSYQIEVIE